MPNLAFQLFSARNTSLPEALRTIADAGYTSVEAYRDNFVDRDSFHRALESTGLSVSSVHIGLDQLMERIDESKALATEFGIKHLVCPYLLPEQRPTNTAGWVDLAKRLTDINSNLTEDGYTFAWHNHDFEMMPLDDGSVPMQLLMDNAPGMTWELDIGWIQRAGFEPLQWIEQYSTRVSGLHIKDIAPDGENEDEDGWADVGHGVVDWAALIPAMRNANTQVIAVEHDNPSDLKRFAENSIRTVNSWNW